MSVNRNGQDDQGVIEGWGAPAPAALSSPVALNLAPQQPREYHLAVLGSHPWHSADLPWQLPEAPAEVAGSQTKRILQQKIVRYITEERAWSGAWQSESKYESRCESESNSVIVNQRMSMRNLGLEFL